MNQGNPGCTRVSFLESLHLNPQSQDILFYDGVCGFCDGLVRWLLRRRGADGILFSPLQGETASRLLSPEERVHLDSVLFWQRDGKRARKSLAIVRILRSMGGGWAFLSLLIGIFPAWIRDGVYDAFAERRYRWFGKKESCTIPSKEDRQRFLP